MPDDPNQPPPTPETPPPPTPEPPEPPAPPEPLKAEDIVAPEGFEVDDTARNSFLEIANKYHISKDAVGDLVKFQADLQKAASERNSVLWAETLAQWEKDAKADPEIGGAKLEPTLGKISQLIDEFGSAELRTAFDLTGAGNNPHVIKFLGKIAEQLSEGKPAPGGTPPTPPASAADLLFPTMRK